ncbi:MAG: hypothetical protein Q8M58_09200, partial [Anaerolineales bacterium]|nr:hypothetical protein [Anaerolineales bacterium]
IRPAHRRGRICTGCQPGCFPSKIAPTGKNVWYSGLRQVAIGLTAAGLVYGVGKLIGISIAG